MSFLQRGRKKDKVEVKIADECIYPKCTECENYKVDKSQYPPVAYCNQEVVFTKQIKGDYDSQIAKLQDENETLNELLGDLMHELAVMQEKGVVKKPASPKKPATKKATTTKKPAKKEK